MEKKYILFNKTSPGFSRPSNNQDQAMDLSCVFLLCDNECVTILHYSPDLWNPEVECLIRNITKHFKEIYVGNKFN